MISIIIIIIFFCSRALAPIPEKCRRRFRKRICCLWIFGDPRAFCSEKANRCVGFVSFFFFFCYIFEVSRSRAVLVVFNWLHLMTPPPPFSFKCVIHTHLLVVYRFAIQLVTQKIKLCIVFTLLDVALTMLGCPRNALCLWNLYVCYSYE